MAMQQVIEKLQNIGIKIKSPYIGLVDCKFNSCVIKQLNQVSLTASDYKVGEQIMKAGEAAKVQIKVLESRLKDTQGNGKPHYYICAYKNNLYEIADFYKFCKDYTERITELAQSGE